MFEFMVFRIKNDDALSSGVAVILIVAAMLSLTYIILTFFGMGVNVASPTKMIALNVRQPTPDQIEVVYYGGRDTATFIGANISIETGSPSKVTGWTWTHSVTNGLGQLDSTVGSNTIATSIGGTSWAGGGNHIIVTGWFSDGIKQIIMNKYL